MRTAIVTGISGQDGAYLSQHLLKKGYRVVGAERRNASGQLWRLKKLGILDQIEFSGYDLRTTDIQKIRNKLLLKFVYLLNCLKRFF